MSKLEKSMGMSITHEYREVCGQAFVNWRLEWRNSSSNEAQHVYFFTRHEAEATKRAITIHCALHDVNLDRLTTISFIMMLQGLKRGQSEPRPSNSYSSQNSTVH